MGFARLGDQSFIVPHCTYYLVSGGPTVPEHPSQKLEAGEQSHLQILYLKSQQGLKMNVVRSMLKQL